MPLVFSVKKLVYKELQPMAQAAKCQMLLVDSKTYPAWTYNLEHKMKALGIAADQYRELIDEIDDNGCIAVLRSKVPYSPAEIARHFSAVGLDENDIHALERSSAKAMFFWWFSVRVVNEDGQALMEKSLADDNSNKQ